MNEYYGSLQEGLGVLKTLPWLMLTLFSVPLFLLAVWRRVYPHVPLVLAFLAPTLLTFALIVHPEWFLRWSWRIWSLRDWRLSTC
ncbi:MAG: hypothetical protein R3C99_04430 [Pirellulaceae bacterium]